MTKKLRERAKISVAHAVPFQIRVERALIVYVVRTRFIRRIHYRLADSTWSTFDGMVELDEENVSWVRGWNNVEAEALAVSVALR